MDVQLLTSIAPIVRDPEASRSFYADALGLGCEGQEGDYVFTHELHGTKHFGLRPLSEAARATYETCQPSTSISSARSVTHLIAPQASE
jgi:catechol 2,3-dioxygenase-like lactoylglutathione lyase family enzyme